MSELSKIFNTKKFNIYFIIFIILIICLFLFEVIIPFALAFIIAYLVNPLKNHLDNFLNETFSSLLSIIFFILCILSVLILVSPIIIQQIQNLISIIPGYINEIEALIKEVNDKYLFSEKIKSLDYINVFKPFTKSLISSGNELIDNGIQFFNSFFNIILTFILSFYMSLEFKKIKNFLYEFAQKSNFEHFPNLISEIDIVLSKFIRGQGLICLILSTFYAVMLFLVGIKFGILLGLFSGIISFIPYVGAFLGGGLTLILGLAQFGNSFELLFLLLIFMSGQLFESYYLTPKLIGDAIKLNPIWIIFALLSGAHFAGFIGVLISLPVAAVLGVLIRFYFLKIFESS